MFCFLGLARFDEMCFFIPSRIHLSTGVINHKVLKVGNARDGNILLVTTHLKRIDIG